MQLILAVGALTAFATSALAGPLRPHHKFWFPITKRQNFTGNVTTAEGYTTPIFLGNASINAPLDCNQDDTYLGFRLFEAPFDLGRCAQACTNQSIYSDQTSTNITSNLSCQFFNTYEISINSTVQGQICALYSETWNTSYATNTGYVSGTTLYSISNSYIASNATDPGFCAPPSNGTNSTAPTPPPTFPNSTVPIGGNGTAPVNSTVPLPVPINSTIPDPIFTNGTNGTVPTPTAGPTAPIGTVTIIPIPVTSLPPSFPGSGYTPQPPVYGSPSYGAPSYGAPSYGAPSYGPPSYGPPSSYGPFSGIFEKLRRFFA